MKTEEKRIKSGVNRRLWATLEEHARAELAIHEGRPLDAEPDEERKLDFIQRRLDVPRALARRIAAYEDPADLPLRPQQRLGAESLQGRTLDFLDARFLKLGVLAAKSVARVADGSHRAVGTGFMVGPGLFLTNHHVISSASEAGHLLIEFERELSLDGADVGPITRFALDPKRLFVFDDTDDLDFALIAVGNRVDGPCDLESFGWLPLFASDDKHIASLFVNVVQHPEGNPKQIVVRENRILARTTNTLIYGADTLQGSSGAPVFNDLWEVVALHHWGVPSLAKRDQPDDAPTSGNEGVRVSSIVSELRARLGQLRGTERDLVEQVTSPRFRAPSLAMAGTFMEHIRGSTHMSQQRKTTESGQPGAVMDEHGGLTVTVPLTISVRLGTQAITPAIPQALPQTVPSRNEVVEKVEVAGPEKLPAPSPDYSSRRGYNPRFLGINVELPRFKDKALQAKRARNLQAKPKDDPFELKYEHFSVVMNQERRLAFFTAVNINGAEVVRIDRETGEVQSVEGAEGYERWYEDPRIAKGEATDQKLYSHPDLVGRFHRGHLVKRTDPSWGTAEMGVRAQADTFHFTNCAPQHRNFNPKASRWAGVETWLTKASDDQDLRMTVFTGCVFREDDPTYGYVQVPLDYWKVVAWVEDGQLAALAILADHRDEVEGGPEKARSAAEGLPPLPKKLPAEYQVTVKEVEELTGLSFGKLSQFDVFAADEPGAESTKRPRQVIGRFEDLQLARPRRSPRNEAIPGADHSIRIDKR